MIFRDRTQAGRLLATRLRVYANRPDVTVLGLPRGGVPVAFELAWVLNAPLDVCLVRKLGVPQNPELAMGAIASGGIQVLNQDVIDSWQITPAQIEQVVAQEQQELQRRETLYRGNRPPLDLQDRTVILVDDGLATGATMHVAALAVREHSPRRTVATVPVSSVQVCQEFTLEVDEIICAHTPEPFTAVGAWYENFSPTTDAEVRNLLERAMNEKPATPSL